MHQNVTDLSAEQHQAIDLLVAGQTISNIAETLGIHRQTLWRWRQNPEFQRIYRQLRAQRIEEIRDLTGETVRLALSVLHREMQSVQQSGWHNRLEKAALVLKILRNEPLYGASEAEGAADA